MIIFTDGSTINNGKKNAYGGIGIYIPTQEDIDAISINYSLKSTNNIKVTNQISELIAAIIGIETAVSLTDDTVYIYTDSKYVIDCATTWCKSWIAKNWKKSNGKCIDNIWLVFRLIQLTKKYPIIFKHIRAHTEEPKNKNSHEYNLWYGNDVVDKLAQNASKSIVELNEDVKTINWNTLALYLINGMTKDTKCNLPKSNELLAFYKKTFNLNINDEINDENNDENNDEIDNEINNEINDENNINKNHGDRYDFLDTINAKNSYNIVNVITNDKSSDVKIQEF